MRLPGWGAGAITVSPRSPRLSHKSPRRTVSPSMTAVGFRLAGSEPAKAAALVARAKAAASRRRFMADLDYFI